MRNYQPSNHRAERRRARKEEREAQKEGTLTGKNNVLKLPLVFYRQTPEGTTYLPFCSFSLHRGIIKNDVSCRRYDCHHYRRFLLQEPSRDVTPQQPGITQYTHCPLGEQGSNNVLQVNLEQRLDP